MKKILLLSNIYPTVKNPDNGVYVQNMAQALEARNIDVKKCVVAGKHNNHWVKLWLYLKFFVHSTSLLLLTRRTVFIHYAGHSAIPVLFVLLFRKLSVVTHVHGTDVVPSANEAGLFSRLKLAVCRAILHRSKTILVPSKHFKTLVSKKFDLPMANIFVNPAGGVDTQVFHPVLKHAHQFNPVSSVVLGFVGRLDAGKGVETLLAALVLIKDSYPHFHCHLVGDGNNRLAYQQLAASLGLVQHCTFHGALPQQQLAAHYASFDYLVFPTELEESLGLVGLEALATGTPVIGSNNAGLLDYLEDQINGFLFCPKKADELACVIKTALTIDAKRYAQLKLNARQTAMKFDAQVATDRLVSWL
jgi:glycosyltransferase involved in cell wall biosynthesis